MDLKKNEKNSKIEILLCDIFNIKITNELINDISFKLNLPTQHEINIFLNILRESKHTKEYLIRKNIIFDKLKKSEYKYIFKPNQNRIFWRFFRNGSKRKTLNGDFLKIKKAHLSMKKQFEPYQDIVDIVDKETGFSVFIFLKNKKIREEIDISNIKEIFLERFEKTKQKLTKNLNNHLETKQNKKIKEKKLFF